MRVVGKILSYGDTDLLNSLLEQGMQAEMTEKGAILVNLPLIKGEDSVYQNIYEIEKYKINLYIELSEYGGNYGLTGGIASVVCGLSGKALKPDSVFTRGTEICSMNACFLVRTEVITVTAKIENDKKVIYISGHKIQFYNNAIRIKHYRIWTGPFNKKLPIALDKYRDAVIAASAKCSCYDCRCVHYAQS